MKGRLSQGIWVSFAAGAVLASSAAALASQEVRIPLPPESARVVAQILFQEFFRAPKRLAIDIQPGWPGASAQVESASCEVVALRPARSEEDLASPANRLACPTVRFAEGGPSVSIELSLRQASLRAWGDRWHEASAFSFSGPAADGLFGALQASHQVRDLPQVLSDGIICDPNGNTCIETYYVSHEASWDSEAALFCAEDTELTDDWDQHGPVAPYEEPDMGGTWRYSLAKKARRDWVHAQAERGIRKRSSLRCVFR